MWVLITCTVNKTHFNKKPRLHLLGKTTVCCNSKRKAFLSICVMYCWETCVPKRICVFCGQLTCPGEHKMQI